MIPRPGLRAVAPACIAVAAVVPATAAGQPVTINEGVAATNDPVLRLTLHVPPGAASVQIAEDAAFTAPLTAPAAPSATFTLAAGPAEERVRVVWVRYLDAEGTPTTDPPASAQIALDTLPPRIRRVALTQRDPVFVCRAGGPTVGGTSRAQLDLDLRISLSDLSSAQIEVDGLAGPRDPGQPLRLRAAPGSPIAVRTRDAVGNVSAWQAVTAPPAAITRLTAATLPFAWSAYCPQPSRLAWTTRIRGAWERLGRPAGHRQVMRVPASQLAWTYYAGQGLGLNWVHAATELKLRLKHGQRGAYRAGVAETIALSTVLRTPSGRTFRLNENLFPTPEGVPPPWRDGMGTAVLLASLVPALAPDAPQRELDLARGFARQYLETLTVPCTEGGVMWNESGPGRWILEYAFRRDDRVLNGSMQALVSVDRFSRQADRLAVRDARWADLAERARGVVLEGARALNHWLPAYDLGAGATRYSLHGGPAASGYRIYHQRLLGQLAQITYLPVEWRRRFMEYRVRWGGAPAAVRA